MTDTRQLAVQTLQNILVNQIFFSEAKEDSALAEHKDMAFINMLVLTALRKLVFINKILKQFVKKKLPEKQAFAHYALIAAATEVLFLETPDYAVINSYVNLVKKNTDKYVAGFINAVLRKICAAKDELLAEESNSFFPQSFLKILQKDYPATVIKQIEAAALQEPALDITAKAKPEFWAEKLEGILLPNGTIRRDNSGKISNLPGYHSGEWWIQDFAASLAVKTLSQTQGLRILDLCAAPGGKTAQLLSAGAKVCALDISENRLKTLAENINRLQLPHPEIICADAIDYLQNFSGDKFDAIILDAPCSATGTIRRHPELVHIKSQNDIHKLAQLQQKILELASNALKPNGELIYCVCSISKEEGEQQISRFLQTNPDFRLVPIASETISCFGQHPDIAKLITQEGFIRTLPHYFSDCGGMDAFFIAKLQKVK